MFLFGLFSVCTLTSVYYCFRFLQTPYTGFHLKHPPFTVKDDAVYFRTEFPFSPAVTSGLISGRDRIKSIDMMEIHTVGDALKILYSKTDFSPITILALRDDSMPYRITISPYFNLFRVEWMLIVLSSCVAGYIGFYLCFAFYDRLEHSVMASAAILAMMGGCVVPFSYTSVFSFILSHTELFVFWAVYFCLRLTTQKDRVKKTTSDAIILLFLFIIYLFFRVYVFHVWSVTGEDRWFVILAEAEKINYIVLGLLSALVILLLMRARAAARIKKQTDWILSGFILWMGPLFFFEQLPRILEYTGIRNMSLDYYSSVFFIIFAVFYLIGIIRQSSEDGRAVMPKSLAYILVVAGSLFMYSTCLVPLTTLMASASVMPPRYTLMVSAFLLFLFLLPLALSISVIVKKKYDRKTTNSIQATFPELSLSELQKSYSDITAAFGELKENFTAALQTEKLHDIAGVVRGMTRVIKNTILRVEKGCMLMKGRLGSLVQLKSKDSGYDALKYKKRIRDMEHTIIVIHKGCLDCLLLCDRFSGTVRETPSIVTSIDCRTLVKQAVCEIKKLFPDTKIPITVEKGVRIQCRPAEIINALTAILQNAQEACTSTSACITVDVCRQAGSVTIKIADRGSGLAGSNRKRLFEPFYSTKEHHFGLGLFMSKIFIEKNSGSIEISGNERKTYVILTFKSAR
ncbi:MAG: HAMP domain-containing histidine kinase [Spirochaetales bacterium]|nr:HAMP domain-containing histidine kinase [Spirochaetales bacterium]